MSSPSLTSGALRTEAIWWLTDPPLSIESVLFPFLPQEMATDLTQVSKRHPLSIRGAATV